MVVVVCCCLLLLLFFVVAAVAIAFILVVAVAFESLRSNSLPHQLFFFSRQNFQAGFAPKEAWSWGALSERFGNSTVRVSLSETGR